MNEYNGKITFSKKDSSGKWAFIGETAFETKRSYFSITLLPEYYLEIKNFKNELLGEHPEENEAIQKMEKVLIDTKSTTGVRNFRFTLNGIKYKIYQNIYYVMNDDFTTAESLFKEIDDFFNE